MDGFKMVLKFAHKQQSGLSAAGVALLTAGGERIFSWAIFKCPCNDWNFLYGMVFVLVPAFALLVLGYILSKRTWKLFTGICLRKSKFRLKYVCGFCKGLFHITTKAMVAPVSWIAVALLNGDYFECAMTGVNRTLFNNPLCKEKDQQCRAELRPCKKETVPLAEQDEVLSTLRAESQILGWLLIASILVSSLLLVCVSRCNSPVSYMQLTFWKSYVQQEGQLLETFSKDHAKDLAKRNLESFFQEQPPESFTTPSKEAWQDISKFYRFSNSKLKQEDTDPKYSRLHQYVDRVHSKEPSNSLSKESPSNSLLEASTPAVLDFVEGGPALP